MFAIRSTEYGMQGRLLGFQEHPFECSSNYASAAVMRCNLDVKDLRRVLPEEHWLTDGEELPGRGKRAHWGYMQHHEWDGKKYVARHRNAEPSKNPIQWEDDMDLQDWRQLLLQLMHVHPRLLQLFP